MTVSGLIVPVLLTVEPEFHSHRVYTFVNIKDPILKSNNLPGNKFASFSAVINLKQTVKSYAFDQEKDPLSVIFKRLQLQRDQSNKVN